MKTPFYLSLKYTQVGQQDNELEVGVELLKGFFSPVLGLFKLGFHSVRTRVASVLGQGQPNFTLDPSFIPAYTSVFMEKYFILGREDFKYIPDQMPRSQMIGMRQWMGYGKGP